jgi:hypothetical protein
MGRETYGLGNVCGKGHVIAEDWIETVGVGIDAVTDHVIVTVITQTLLVVTNMKFGANEISVTFIIKLNVGTTSTQ